ncbi:MAG TPA: thrombospondin type 3 repeat-containing protein, partial [Candidatus Polarisedimenticolia bacterium]|nr:thrombospondin type 3 repeat-containing protein [Candidatus Polarisedimenticolia bacterium]
MLLTRTGRTAALVAILLGVMLPALAPSTARAEERKGSWEAGGFFGTTFYAKELALPNPTHYGLRVGWNFRPAYELELQYLRNNDETLKSGDSTLITFPGVFTTNPRRKFGSDSLTLRFLINPTNERRRFKPYMLFGSGIVSFSSNPKLASVDEGVTRAIVVSVGGGARFRLGAHTYLRGEFESQYAPSEIFHNEHVNAGITFNWGGQGSLDTDGDGVLDVSDRCPDTPQGALVDKHDGCPWDLDGDGVLEGLDACPNTPRGWPVDAKGCPLDSDGDAVPDGADSCPDTPKGAIVDKAGCPLDSDGDTIFDGIDRCPDTPKGAIVDPVDSATPGCPRDADGDGVPDGIDECPLTPPGATVDEKGCPKDSDGDRVLDGIDECPDTPPDEKIDAHGCPRVRLDRDEPQLLQNVIFYNGAQLYPGADAWVELLLEAMNYWTDVSVELDVYTDSTGTPAGNRTIAQRRGEVVKAWLVDHGIDPRRIIVKAMGAVDFVADNDTEEGRAKNRRVEVKRISGSLRKHPKPAPPAPE